MIYIYESNTTLGIYIGLQIERKKLKVGMNNYILVILEYYHKVQNLNNTFEISFCTRHLIMQFCIMLDNIK